MTVASGDCRPLIESRSLKYKNRTQAENNREIPLKECFCAIPNAHLSLTTKDLSKSTFHGLLLGVYISEAGNIFTSKFVPQGCIFTRKYVPGGTYFGGVQISC